jgi:hypothetical protein
VRQPSLLDVGSRAFEHARGQVDTGHVAVRRYYLSGALRYFPGAASHVKNVFARTQISHFHETGSDRRRELRRDLVVVIGYLIECGRDGIEHGQAPIMVLTLNGFLSWP